MQGADFPVVGCGHRISGLLATGQHLDVVRLRDASDRGARSFNLLLGGLPALGSGRIDHDANGCCNLTGRSIVGVNTHRSHQSLLLRGVIVLSFETDFHLLVNFVRCPIFVLHNSNVAVVVSAQR